MIANSGPLDPIIDTGHAETWEIVAWGACLSIGILLLGVGILRQPNRVGQRSRGGCLLIMLGLLAVTGGCVVSYRDHGQWGNERLRQIKEARDAENSKVPRDTPDD